LATHPANFEFLLGVTGAAVRLRPALLRPAAASFGDGSSSSSSSRNSPAGRRGFFLFFLLLFLSKLGL